MKIIELDKPVSIGFVARRTPDNGDLITIKLVNELSGFTLNLPTTWSYSKQRLNISFDGTQADFKAGNKYQITLKNGANVIYLGNLLIVKENTNLQNYTPLNQTTVRYKTKAV